MINEDFSIMIIMIINLCCIFSQGNTFRNDKSVAVTLAVARINLHSDHHHDDRDPDDDDCDDDDHVSFPLGGWQALERVCRSRQTWTEFLFKPPDLLSSDTSKQNKLERPFVQNKSPKKLEVKNETLVGLLTYFSPLS